MGQKRILKEFQSTNKSEWIKETDALLKGQPISKLSAKTLEGITIQPYYTSEDNINYHLETEIPGIPPYKRGISDFMYKQQHWLVCQELNLYNPVDYNRMLIENLQKGQTAINLRILSSNTQFSKKATGTYISCADDFVILFKSIDIRNYALYIEVNTDALYTLDLLSKYLKSMKYQPEDLNIFILFDPISQLTNQGYLQEELDELFNTMKRINEEYYNYEGVKAIGINSVIYRNKGADLVQEMAFAISSAMDYIYILADEKIPIDNILSKIHFTVSVGNDFFMEIAKFRALRIIWSKIVENMGGNVIAQKMHIRAKSTSTNKSQLDKHTNMLRATTETLSAIIGGCEAITILPFNSPFHSGNDFARRVARNTQLVLENECNLTEVIDPAGGSWFIEDLTNQIVNKTWDLINQIEEQGGFIKSLLSGFVKKIIDESKEKKISSINTRKEILIGVNKYPNLSDDNEEDERTRYIMQANDYRSKLKGKPEISKQENKITIDNIDDLDLSDSFLVLRRNSQHYKSLTGNFPKAFLAGFGPSKQHKSRMTFAKEFLSVGGIQCLQTEGLTNDEIKNTFISSGLKIFVICSTDETYPDIIPNIIPIIKNEKPDTVFVLAGYPIDMADHYKQSGIEYFVHLKANIYQVISNLYQKLEAGGSK